MKLRVWKVEVEHSCQHETTCTFVHARDANGTTVSIHFDGDVSGAQRIGDLWTLAPEVRTPRPAGRR